MLQTICDTFVIFPYPRSTLRIKIILSCRDAHVDALCFKVASRLYFVKLLKRSGLSAGDLLCFYKSAIHSVLEYGSVVWHHQLTHAQSDKVEALQKRAVRIILYPLTLPYITALGYLKWSHSNTVERRL